MKKNKIFLVLLATGLLITSCSENNKNNSSSDASSSVESSQSVSSETSSSTSSTSSSEVEIPELNQAMLDVFDTEYISFAGTNEIALYDIRTNKYNSSLSLNVSTAMDGTYWTATYESSIGTESTLFYKNYNDIACEVSVNLMNEEGYTPALDEDGKTIPWEEAGMKNYLDELVVDDFTYNNETGRYHYNKKDFTLINNIVSSANPYEFVPKDFSLIISDNEIIGINVVSEYDTTLSAGYKAKQTLVSTINYGEDIVEVDKIQKFDTESYHSNLKEALEKMRSLTSYKAKVRFITQSIYASGITIDGYYETVTPTDLYFEELKPAADNNSTDSPIPNTGYGYHKFSDTKYNSFFTQENEDKTFSYQASRAYNGTIKDVQPSFAFAPEIMSSYKYDEKTGERYYFADDKMCSVATTFYNAVGNDVNTYGIFASRGYTSSTESFTPYVVVNAEGYITYSCFYFNLGLMYGVCEISYSDFNTATLPSDTTISFEERSIPSSWSELSFIKSNTSDTTAEDELVNAGDYLKTFYEDNDILSKLPFFGGENYLGDSFGLGMIGQIRPEGMQYYLNAVTLYYDVPLDLNYSIDSSMKKVYKCLEDSGFKNIGNHVYVKGDIVVQPIDKELDLVIYIYRTKDNPTINK